MVSLNTWRNWSIFFLLLAGMMPWLMVMENISINGDVIWLIHAAERILSGDEMTERFYDDNPPLSYILYIPVALLSNYGIPSWYALDLYVVTIASISIGLTALLLSKAPGLGRSTFWIVIAGFSASLTFPARFEIGQKDHFIAMMLLPFLSAQFALTQKWLVSKFILRFTFVLAAPFFLIKPHYLLLPIFSLLYRVFRQKRIWAIFDFDALCLFISGIIYAVIIVVRFPDFLTKALREIVILYAQEVNPLVWPAVIALFAFGGFLTLSAYMIDQQNKLRPYAIFICSMGTLSVLPVLLQLKGFSVHLLPAFSLLNSALLLVASQFVAIPKKFNRAWLGVVSVLIVAYCILPAPIRYPTHDFYKSSSMARYIKSHAAGKPVFIQTSSTNVIEPLSEYTQTALATRFPSLWFMPGFMQNNDPLLRKAFQDDIAEDIIKGQPAFIALYDKPKAEEDFLAFMHGHTAFAKEWAHYQQRDKLILDPAEYFTGSPYEGRPPVIYNVYNRQF